MTSVGEIMNKHVETCLINDTLETAAMKMWDHDIQGELLAELCVENVMSKERFVCRAKDSLLAGSHLPAAHATDPVPASVTMRAFSSTDQRFEGLLRRGTSRSVRASMSHRESVC